MFFCFSNILFSPAGPRGLGWVGLASNLVTLSIEFVECVTVLKYGVTGRDRKWGTGRGEVTKGKEDGPRREEVAGAGLHAYIL